MKIPLVSLALILAFASLSFAQNPFVYDQSSDLKGLKKVYVDTGLDRESRKDIIKDLNNSSLGFEIVDHIESAEILLGFGTGTVIERLTRRIDGDSIVLHDPSSRTGVGIIIAHVRSKDRFVLSFSSADSGGPAGPSKYKPVADFMREFIKIYKEGNDLE
jgi:hypothetical protein